MNRLWPVLVAFMMLGPVPNAWTVPIQDECQDVSDCDEGGECDFDCSQCVCCAHRNPVVTTVALSAPPEDLPEYSTSTAQVAPLAPPPTDILHVPKSL